MSDYALWWYFIGLVFLILVSGFFSGSEIGMMSLNRYRLRHLVKEKNRQAERVETLLKRPDRLLGVILIGNTFANILASALCTMIAVHFFGELGVVLATIVLTLVVLIFAEVMPKTVAALYAQRFAFVVSLPLKYLLSILYPLVVFVNFLANGMLKLIGVSLKKPMMEALSREELRTVVDEASGRIPDEHVDMLLSILDLETVTVEDIMIPRNEIVGIDLQDDWDDIMNQLTSYQHTRIPVYSEGIDHVRGILHMRLAMNLIAQDRLGKDTLLEATSEPYFVPEGTLLNTQLLNFRNEKMRMGLVVDEYGDIKGLVTIEDILEEVVGEFTTDLAASSKDVHPQKDGSYLVDGSITLRELNRMMQWNFPEAGPKTLSGLVTDHLQAIPTARVCISIAGYRLEIIKMKDNRVKTVRILAGKFG